MLGALLHCCRCLRVLILWPLLLTLLPVLRGLLLP